jgi:hypothetical protein
MTPYEFVIWMKGFVAGSNNFNLTPAGWQELKDTLEKVEEKDKKIYR